MKKIVVGITGASGHPYAKRLLEVLPRYAETHAVFTKNGRLVWNHEVGPGDPPGVTLWPAQDMTAPFASGSARFDAMAVVPCSAGSLARIAQGLSADLVGRAADVMLKERRPLVLCLRETPFNLIHIRNMQAVTEAGAIVMPASPGFYSQPKSIAEMVDNVVGRMLDLMKIDNDLPHRWEGM